MPDETAPPFDFLEFLRNAEDGVLVGDLTDAIRNLLANLHQTQLRRGGNPSGSLSITFGLMLGQSGDVEVTAAFSDKLPKSTRPRTIMYRTPDNALSPNNPRQLSMTLPARPVDAPAQSIRIV